MGNPNYEPIPRGPFTDLFGPFPLYITDPEDQNIGSGTPSVRAHPHLSFYGPVGLVVGIGP